MCARSSARWFLREGEHTKAFRKRICGLGFGATIEEAPALADRTAIACATDLTDREKFEKLGLGTPPDVSTPDRWATYFNDTTIDIATGELLGRFVSEERDSVRLFAGCYNVLCGEEAAPAVAVSTEDRLDRIEGLLGRLVAGMTDQDRAGTMTEAAFRAGLRADGFDDEIRITNYAPCVEPAELHGHDFSARVFVVEGEFILHYEDGPQTLTAGQSCQLDAGARHAEASGEAGARVLAGLKHHR